MFHMMQSYLLLVVCTLGTLVGSIAPCSDYKYKSRYISKTVEVTYYTSCGLFGWRRCTRYREQIQYVKESYRQLGCCTGYGGLNCTPICNLPCATNMECTSPDNCTCVEGWKGADCLLASPPTNITVIPADSTSVLIQWMPPAVPNGIIKHYNLYINYSNNTNMTTRIVDGNFTLYLLRNLNTFQLVGVSISATTGGGEGPMSSYAMGRSGETEPDQVHYLKVEITSNISVNISWHPPATLKGIVINYHLILRNITREHSDFIMSLWILESSDLNHHIQGLYPYIPYEVDVAAATQIGKGEIVTKSFFTEQSVPAVSPRWSYLERVSATQIKMEWEAISLEDSRGYLVGYYVTYAPSILGCSAMDKKISISISQQIFLLDKLNPQKEYCISLAAFTEKGTGIASDNALIPVYESMNIFIFIDGILDCLNWVQRQTQNKIRDLSNGIVETIYESCQCPVTTDYIYNSHFLPCDGELAVVQLSIVGLASHKIETPVEIVERWAKTSPVVILEGVEVKIAKACKFLNCSTTSAPTDSSSIDGNSSISETENSTMSWLLMVIGCMSLICICMVVIICCICIIALKVKKQRKTESYGINVPLSNAVYEDMSGVSKVEDETDAKGMKVYENDIMEKPMHSAGYNIYAQIYDKN